MSEQGFRKGPITLRQGAAKGRCVARVCLLAVLATLAAPPPGQAASLGERMAQAMTRMMERFADRRQDYGGSTFDWPSPPQGWSGFAPGGMGGMPWGGSSPGAFPWSDSLSRWAPPYQMPGFPPASGAGRGTAQPLNGAWVSNTGIGVIIRGDRLRLVSENDRYREMTLRYADGHVWLYDQDSGVAKRYEYAHADDRMAMRDTEGNTWLFRRWEPSQR